ncbi:MAG: acetyl-CoA carboxylase biotin carboxyl carrier protein [Streptomycetaceae bacterium]|nr:acetyl-CoA carboxylase biotin carboxyl carrier protein [Streptomycetaceae bacterium]
MTVKRYAMELEPLPQLHAGGTSSQGAFDGAAELTPAATAEHLARTATRLVRTVDGPLSRVRVQQGDTVVELEWPQAVTSTSPCLPGAPPAAGREREVSPGMAAAPAVDMTSAAAAAGMPPPAAVQPSPSDPRTDGSAAADAPDQRRFHITAPMVGAFYHAPEPGATPFVQEGDLVEKGQHIGIVEAMKLMNPIQAEQPGRVVEVLVGDGHPVEYDQPLIALEPLDSTELNGMDGMGEMDGMGYVGDMKAADRRAPA